MDVSHTLSELLGDVIELRVLRRPQEGHASDGGDRDQNGDQDVLDERSSRLVREYFFQLLRDVRDNRFIPYRC